MRVRLTKPAKAELDVAMAYLERQSPRAADAAQLAVDRTIDSLADFPNRGRQGALAGTRELVVRGAPYVLVYVVGDDEVLVLRIRHTSQDPTP